ncbi:hypothetical protein [Nocardia terpenica]|uniref:Uncharacterized protein n=1 Tax=Nocardia terpenica TaxID=455432 RepID=A0A164K1V2_9NOCA|nr:hypothetical protein [Nocardia terpenica]KZM70943.1 hypothetical protein AWN90_41195 [Nocardia terpenica]NQE89748.1 hypothetical protein [Nocardia terpenica]
MTIHYTSIDEDGQARSVPIERCGDYLRGKDYQQIARLGSETDSRYDLEVRLGPAIAEARRAMRSATNRYQFLKMAKIKFAEEIAAEKAAERARADHARAARRDELARALYAEHACRTLTTRAAVALTHIEFWREVAETAIAFAEDAGEDDRRQ